MDNAADEMREQALKTLLEMRERAIKMLRELLLKAAVESEFDRRADKGWMLHGAALLACEVGLITNDEWGAFNTEFHVMQMASIGVGK